MTIFAFTDVETTGLDPQGNFILEVAWRLTDYRFEPLSEPKTFIVEHGLRWPEVAQQIRDSEFLTNMHQTSGLLGDLSNPEVEKTWMEDIVDAFVLDALNVGAATDMVRFAGYSVSFDREFLRAHWWKNLIETKDYGFQMHHRIMDLSSVIQMWQAADLQEPSTWNDNPHRALDDALDSLAKAQAFRDELSMLKAYFGG